MRVHAATCPCPGRRRPPLAVRLSLLLALLAPVPACLAGGGLFGLDQELTYDDRGIWKRNYQQALEYGLIGGEVVGALWEGGETRFGRTLPRASWPSP
jgi:hypothetical protein